MDIRDTNLSYTEVETLIGEWIIGKNAFRDREILARRLLDGYSYNRLADLFYEPYGLSVDQIRRIVRKREAEFYRQFFRHQ